MQKDPPRETPLPGGVLLCLLALAATVKPLAHIIANYIANYVCSDRREEFDQDLQQVPPLSVARFRKGSNIIIYDFYHCVKGKNDIFF